MTIRNMAAAMAQPAAVSGYHNPIAATMPPNASALTQPAHLLQARPQASKPDAAIIG